jgi:hypothetical protein
MCIADSYSLTLHAFSVHIRNSALKTAVRSILGRRKQEDLKWTTRGKDTEGTSFGRVQVWEVMEEGELVC